MSYKRTTYSDEKTNDVLPTENIKNLRKEEYDNFCELAKELSYNYFANSFGNSERSNIVTSDIFDNISWGKEFYQRSWIEKERVRNILVVGAGASYDAYKAIHIGTGLINEMQNDYGNYLTADERTEYSFLRNRFKRESDEIQEITSIPPNESLENYLYLLSNHFILQEELREKIKKMTALKYAPSLVNEIIAHLLKHSFLDVVVNFNFEETLDQAIEEEIGVGNYYSVISDGHCVSLQDIAIEGRLKTPIYIKPHGSNSHKSTLRFTNKHYFEMPIDIKVMLEDLFQGKRSGKSEENIQKINLIVVGFALQSLEFNKILNLMPAKSRIYHIDTAPINDINKENSCEKEKFLKRSLKPFFKNALIMQTAYSDIYKPISLNLFSQNQHGGQQNQNTLTPPLGEMFSVMWRIANNGYAKPYRPRSIAKHEINSYLFYEPLQGVLTENEIDDKTQSEIKRKRDYVYQNFETNTEKFLFDKNIGANNSHVYFLDKTLVEIVLTFNRNNGIIDIIEILRSRVGKFYDLYKKTAPKIDEPQVFSLHELLMEIATDYRSDGLFNHARNIYVLENIFSEQDFSLQNVLNIWNGYAESIEDNLAGTHCKYTDRNLVIENSKKVKDTLDRIIEKELERFSSNTMDIELGPKPTEIVISRTFTLLGRLLRSRKISDRFKINLLRNYNRIVHNGKGKTIYGEIGESTMLEEVYRLLKKTVGHQYFVINSHPKDPGHHMFESFEEKNLKHTNLSLTYSFSNIFKNTNWDVALLVLETGNLLEFLKYEINKEKLSKVFDNRNIILICSYESVKQLYFNKNAIDELSQVHKLLLQGNVIQSNRFTLLFSPFREHNHHSMIFLKKVPLLTHFHPHERFIEEDDSFKFKIVNSLYMYRNGFSNSIAPLLIHNVSHNDTEKVIKDQCKLLALFYNQLLRSINFYRSAYDSSLNTDASPHLHIRDLYQRADELASYKTWDSATFLKSMNIFLKGLYNETES